MPTLTRIRIYPIKSCRGYDCESAELDHLGLVNDRRFQVITPDGKPFTQRSHGILAQVSAHISANELQVRAPAHGQFSVPLNRPQPSQHETEVWSATGLIADGCGKIAAEFFSSLLRESSLLVSTGSAFDRPVRAHPHDQVGFADAFPLLIISEASLAGLNQRISAHDSSVAPIAMERFRPNLVVNDCSEFAEDTWRRLRIDDCDFESSGPCERCVMTTLDPQTGDKTGPEPLRTLATYRRIADGSGVGFGQNLVNTSKSGRIEVGSSIDLID